MIKDKLDEALSLFLQFAWSDLLGGIRLIQPSQLGRQCLRTPLLYQEK